MSTARMNDFFESRYPLIPMDFPLQLNTRMTNIRVQQLKRAYSLWCEYGSDVENSTINSSEISARVLVKLLNEGTPTYIGVGKVVKRILIHGPNVLRGAFENGGFCVPIKYSTRNYGSSCPDIDTSNSRLNQIFTQN